MDRAPDPLFKPSKPTRIVFRSVMNRPFPPPKPSQENDSLPFPYEFVVVAITSSLSSREEPTPPPSHPEKKENKNRPLAVAAAAAAPGPTCFLLLVISRFDLMFFPITRDVNGKKGEGWRGLDWISRLTMDETC